MAFVVIFPNLAATVKNILTFFITAGLELVNGFQNEFLGKNPLHFS